MRKREALEAAIRSAVDSWMATPFVWGASDCLLSLADIILAARGYDPAEPFRGRYTSRIGAIRVTREFGGFDGALESMLYDAGWREIEPRKALIGDIGILKDAAGTVGGVIRDIQLWVGRKHFGIVALPTASVARAWRAR